MAWNPAGAGVSCVSGSQESGKGPSRTIGVCLVLGGSFSHGESVSLCTGLPGLGEK